MPSMPIQVAYGTEPPNGANEGQMWVDSGSQVVKTFQSGQWRPGKGNGTIAVVARTPATIVTAGAATYTAAQMLGGLILRDPTGASRSDVTPTAALLIAAIAAAYGAANPEDTFICDLINTADAAETITITAGNNVTLVPATVEVDQNQSCRLVVRIVTATTITIYALTAGGT